MFPLVTRFFIRKIIRKGRLAEARQRYDIGSAKPSSWNVNNQSCWSLICEEVLDTDLDSGHYDAIYAELRRREFSATEIDQMRTLAWQSAGWLNYNLMLWEWCQLDESDMREALKVKRKKWLIRKKTFTEGMKAIENALERDQEFTKTAGKLS